MIKRLLIIGESCKDIYVYCDSHRLCPDMPVPVLNVRRQIESNGMAGNVKNNTISLGLDCDLITNPGWETISKTRYVHDKTNHMFIRIDTDHNIPRIKIPENFTDYQYVIISDYNKGFLKEEDIEYICSKHSLVFLDTKKKLGSWANNAKFIKINNYEYDRSKESLTPLLESKIIRTTGPEGCIYNNEIFPVKGIEVVDSSGCGDTFLAGLVCEYIKTRDIKLAIKFANTCASEVARHRGVSIAINID